MTWTKSSVSLPFHPTPPAGTVSTSASGPGPHGPPSRPELHPCLPPRHRKHNKHTHTKGLTFQGTARLCPTSVGRSGFPCPSNPAGGPTARHTRTQHGRRIWKTEPTLRGELDMHTLCVSDGCKAPLPPLPRGSQTRFIGRTSQRRQEGTYCKRKHHTHQHSSCMPRTTAKKNQKKKNPPFSLEAQRRCPVPRRHKSMLSHSVIFFWQLPYGHGGS